MIIKDGKLMEGPEESQEVSPEAPITSIAPSDMVIIRGKMVPREQVDAPPPPPTTPPIPKDQWVTGQPRGVSTLEGKQPQISYRTASAPPAKRSVIPGVPPQGLPAPQSLAPVRTGRAGWQDRASPEELAVYEKIGMERSDIGAFADPKLAVIPGLYAGPVDPLNRTPMYESQAPAVSQKQARDAGRLAVFEKMKEDVRKKAAAEKRREFVNQYRREPTGAEQQKIREAGALAADTFEAANKDKWMSGQPIDPNAKMSASDVLFAPQPLLRPGESPAKQIAGSAIKFGAMALSFVPIAAKNIVWDSTSKFVDRLNKGEDLRSAGTEWIADLWDSGWTEAINLADFAVMGVGVTRDEQGELHWSKEAAIEAWNRDPVGMLASIAMLKGGAKSLKKGGVEAAKLGLRKVEARSRLKRIKEYRKTKEEVRRFEEELSKKVGEADTRPYDPEAVARYDTPQWLKEEMELEGSTAEVAETHADRLAELRGEEARDAEGAGAEAQASGAEDADVGGAGGGVRVRDAQEAGMEAGAGEVSQAAPTEGGEVGRVAPRNSPTTNLSGIGNLKIVPSHGLIIREGKGGWNSPQGLAGARKALRERGIETEVRQLPSGKYVLKRKKSEVPITPEEMEMSKDLAFRFQEAWKGSEGFGDLVDMLDEMGEEQAVAKVMDFVRGTLNPKTREEVFRKMAQEEAPPAERVARGGQSESLTPYLDALIASIDPAEIKAEKMKLHEELVEAGLAKDIDPLTGRVMRGKTVKKKEAATTEVAPAVEVKSARPKRAEPVPVAGGISEADAIAAFMAKKGVTKVAPGVAEGAKLGRIEAGKGGEVQLGVGVDVSSLLRKLDERVKEFTLGIMREERQKDVETAGVFLNMGIDPDRAAQVIRNWVGRKELGREERVKGFLEELYPSVFQGAKISFVDPSNWTTPYDAYFNKRLDRVFIKRGRPLSELLSAMGHEVKHFQQAGKTISKELEAERRAGNKAINEAWKEFSAAESRWEQSRLPEDKQAADVAYSKLADLYQRTPHEKAAMRRAAALIRDISKSGLFEIKGFDRSTGMAASVKYKSEGGGTVLRAGLSLEDMNKALGFFSRAQRAVRDSVKSPMTVTQFEGWLSKQVGQEEFRQIWKQGDPIPANGRTLTPQEMQEFVDRGVPQFREIELGQQRYRSVGDRNEAVNAYRDQLYAKYGDGIRLKATPEELRKLDELAEGGVGDTSKYSTYTLPGVENYREVLWQRNSDTPPLATLLEEQASLEREITRNDIPGTYREQLESELAHIEELISRTDSQFTGGHWSEHGYDNVQMHARIGDIRDVEGKSGILAMEVQADWPKAENRWRKTLEEDPAAGLDFQESPVPPPAMSVKKATEMAVKRLIGKAAEEGKDRVYSPSTVEQIAKIENYGEVVWKEKGALPEWREAGMDGLGIQVGDRAFVIRDSDQGWVIEEHRVGREPEPEIVVPSKKQAKEYVEEQIKDVAVKESGWYVQGTDANVTGIVQTYLQHIPNFFKEQAKKWGVATGKTEYRPSKATHRDTGAGLQPIPNEPLHYIDVPSAVKEKGQSLYSGFDPATLKRLWSEDTAKKIDEATAGVMKRLISVIPEEDRKLWYHGTVSTFDQFAKTKDIGFHFGDTPSSAWGRLFATAYENPEGAQTQRVRLDVKNPLRMEDLGMWEPEDIIEYGLKPRRLITEAQKASILESSDKAVVYERLRQHIMDKGFDGILYRNLEEGGYGIIAFDPKQIKNAIALYSGVPLEEAWRMVDDAYRKLQEKLKDRPGLSHAAASLARTQALGSPEHARALYAEAGKTEPMRAFVFREYAEMLEKSGSWKDGIPPEPEPRRVALRNTPSGSGGKGDIILGAGPFRLEVLEQRKKEQEFLERNKLTLGEKIMRLKTKWVDDQAALEAYFGKMGPAGQAVWEQYALTRGTNARTAERVRNAERAYRYDSRRKRFSTREQILQDELALRRRIYEFELNSPRKGKVNHPVTLEEVRRFVHEFEKGGPIEALGLSAERAKEIWDSTERLADHHRKLLEDMRDEGRITPAMYDKLQGAFYNPRMGSSIYRFGSKKVRDRTKLGRIMDDPSVQQKGVEALRKGEEGEILETNPLRTFQFWAIREDAAMARNRVGKVLKDLADQFPDGVVSTEKKDGYIPIKYWEDGKAQKVYMPKDVAEQLFVKENVVQAQVLNALRLATGAQTFKALTTGANPIFGLKNIVQDAHSVLLSGQYRGKNGKWKHLTNPLMPVGALELTNFFRKVLGDAVTRGPLWQEYLKDYGGLEFLVHQAKLPVSGSEFSKRLGKVYDVLAYTTETSEIAMRLAVKEMALEKIAKREGLTVEEARKNWKLRAEATYAARSYADFGRSGSYARAADSVLPYLNAGIQVTRGMLRAAGRDKTMFAFKSAQLLGISAMLYYYNSKNYSEAMADLSPEQRINYFNIILPYTRKRADGTTTHAVISIPKDPFQRLMSTLFEWAAAPTNPEDLRPMEKKHVLRALAGVGPTGSLPPIVRAFAAGIAGIDVDNARMLYGEEGPSGASPTTRYREGGFGTGTSQFAMDVGQLAEEVGLEWSPTRIEEVADSYGFGNNIYSAALGGAWTLMRKGAEPFEGVDPEDVLKAMGATRFALSWTNPGGEVKGIAEKVQRESKTESANTRHRIEKAYDLYMRRGRKPEDLDKVIDVISKESLQYPQNPSFIEEKIMGVMMRDLAERSQDPKLWIKLSKMRAKDAGETLGRIMKDASGEKKDRLEKDLGLLTSIATDSFWLGFNEGLGVPPPPPQPEEPQAQDQITW